TNSSPATMRTSSDAFQGSCRSSDTWTLICSIPRASAVSSGDVVGGAAVVGGAVVVGATVVEGASVVVERVATRVAPPLRPATAAKPPPSTTATRATLSLVNRPGRIEVTVPAAHGERAAGPQDSAEPLECADDQPLDVFI